MFLQNFKIEATMFQWKTWFMLTLLKEPLPMVLTEETYCIFLARENTKESRV